MPEFKLSTSLPLGGPAPVSDQFNGLEMSEIGTFHLASLAARSGQEKSCIAIAKKQLGLSLPTPGHMANGPDFNAIWTGPQQWFIETDNDEHEDIAKILKTAFGEKASITEQSGGWTRFDLSGPACRLVLQRLCAVDIAAMKTNDATRTAMEHLGVFLLCRNEGSHYSVIGPRSSAASLYHALKTAAKSAL